MAGTKEIAAVDSEKLASDDKKAQREELPSETEIATRTIQLEPASVGRDPIVYRVTEKTTEHGHIKEWN